MKDCICRFCGKKYIYSRICGHTLSKCNSCMTNTRKNKLKIKCVEYKGGKCESCGYNKCMRALSFHHLDPTKKDFGISGAHCKKWSVIQKELDKCILVCANCHAEIHSNQTQVDP